MAPIQRSQLVSVVCAISATAGTKYFFPDIPELRDALVDGLETYVDTELAADGSGNPSPTTTQIALFTTTLVQESDRRAMDFPLQSLRASAYGGLYKEFTGWKLNWQKCYLQTTGALAALVSVPVNVFYHYPKGKR